MAFGGKTLREHFAVLRKSAFHFPLGSRSYLIIVINSYYLVMSSWVNAVVELLRKI